MEKLKCCPPGQRSDSLGEYESIFDELAVYAKALAHPARVQILKFLLERNECVCGDIVDELPLAQSTVSQHLKVLKEAGLIQGEISGTSVCYCVDKATLKRFKSLLSKEL